MSEPGGSWQELGGGRRYLETRSVHCTCCGRMLVARAWVEDDRRFCEPSCATLYREFWLPRHGEAA
jgi:hypothetical protein